MIDIRGLCVTFPGFRLGPVDLRVEPGEFFAIMGPTGSGKTLLLESVAGLVQPGHGTITVDGRDVTRLAPEHRRVGLVYQDHALFPHMTVEQNITYGLRYHGLDNDDGRAFAGRLMEVLGLAPLAGRRPANLSGGEKQRTALARALASEPAVVLLDEPLSSLDPQFREDVRRTLGELHAATSTTFLMVTHDFSDALTLARRAALVRQGAIEQVGGVDEVFGRPATPFAARFVGMKNLLPAGLVGGRSGLVAIRPEDAELLPPEQDADRTAGAAEREKRGPVLPCLVERVFREGFSWAVEVSCGEHKLSVRLSSEQGAAGRSLPGTRARVLLPADRLHRLPHAAENDAHATEGKNPGGGC